MIHIFVSSTKIFKKIFKFFSNTYNKMDNIDLENINPIEYLVTPVTPYFICDHFISNEIHEDSNIYMYEIKIKSK